MSEHLEHLLRATLAEDGTAYPVSIGALSHLQEHLAGTPDEPSPHRRRFAGVSSARLGLAGGVLIGVAAAIVVLLAAVLTPTTQHAGRALSLRTVGAPPAESIAPAPPPSIAGVRSLKLNFTASRLLLGSPDVWAFGADSAKHPWVARIHDQTVVRQKPLPAPVCSASLDGTGVIAVIVQNGPSGAQCTDRSGRGVLGLLDPVSLDMLTPSVPAAGGDTLVRPEGTYSVDAGVISLLDGATLAPTGVRYRLGSTNAVVNLAGDPDQSGIFATVLEPGHPTRLYFLRRHTLTLTRNGVNLAANQGAIPYATADGAVWVSRVAAGLPGDPSTGASASAAELHPASGPVTHVAFEGSPLMANFAESGTKLWALDADGTLRCASLKTGDLAGASAAPAPGIIAADKDNVFLAPDAHRLDILTPSATCGG